MADEYDITEEFALTAEDGEDNALNFGGSDTPPAQFGNGQTVISGTISGMQWGDYGGAFYATNGLAVVPKPPLADAIGGPGLFAGAEYKKLQGKKPTVVSGTLNLPLAQAGAGQDATTEDTPGGLVGIGYSEDGCFGITDGVARIPRPESYEFDPEWFEVIDGQVTLKNAAIDVLINELVDELAVNIDVTTDLEHVNVKAGEKIIRATSDATLKLDTSVKAVNV